MSAVLLTVGYYLAVTTTNDTIIERLLPVTGMVIVGTYFLFTQLSVFAIRILQRNRALYWKQTNLITLSTLAYRLKDNAHMFFLVTIVSTVAFCAVGALAATGTMSKKYELNFPFAVSYASYGENPSEAKHLAMIEADLQRQQVLIEKVSVTVKSQTSKTNGNKVVLVSETDYNRLANSLGYPAQSIAETEAKLIPGNISQIEKVANQRKPVTFQESGITLKINGAVEKPIFSRALMGMNLLLISDQVYDSIQVSEEMNRENWSWEKATYVGYTVKDWQETTQIGEQVNQELLAFYQQSEGPFTLPRFGFITSGAAYLHALQVNSVMLFVGLLVGAVFFIAAGSFLYFRLYMDLDHDRRQYQAITKIGLSEKELTKIVTTQLLLLFFVPLVVAVIHSSFAFVALQSMFQLSIAFHTISVLLGFIAAQIAYFLLIRARYTRHVKEAVL
ncbi:hypothetical protein LOK74_14245 [Brevibacillus humidisoli]|uniref:FtsX-like permease family protein n=1 Tax=Brevibacillus humidisoli TaxID=2895522 RepID=UPI001E492FD3|nr:FtsX-like permease family protein [Brevibacillus humidisoli]UFJ39230.1 hypothetical protein LOK74_14245 [Brevibacillus humidisoli]